MARRGYGLGLTRSLILLVFVEILALAGTFGGSCFSLQAKLENACNDSASIAASAGTPDLATLQDKVNGHTLSLKHMNGFKAIVSVSTDGSSVTVHCSRTVKPTLGSLFGLSHGIHGTAKTTATRTS